MYGGAEKYAEQGSSRERVLNTREGVLETIKFSFLARGKVTLLIWWLATFTAHYIFSLSLYAVYSVRAKPSSYSSLQYYYISNMITAAVSGGEKCARMTNDRRQLRRRPRRRHRRRRRRCNSWTEKIEGSDKILVVTSATQNKVREKKREKCKVFEIRQYKTRISRP